MLEYIVFPVEGLSLVPQERLDELHLAPRKSVDGTQVIMKSGHYKELFPDKMIMTLDPETEEPSYRFPYTLYSGEELTTLLNGNNWTSSESADSGQTPTLMSAADPSTKSVKSSRKAVKPIIS